MKRPTDEERAADMAQWCDMHDLSADGTPLPAMEIARRALARQLADERKQAETPRYKIPFYKLPFARDL